MIIFDSPKNGWVHLVSDSISELHAFASSIGIKRCWFGNKSGKNQPHYDVRIHMIPILLLNGAVQVTNKELFLFLEKHYQK